MWIVAVSIGGFVSKPKLRLPTPLFERIKIPLILLAYIAANEWASPFPFSASLNARLAVLALILFVLRAFHHARCEGDEDWAGRTADVEARLRTYTSRVSQQTWLRLQRVVSWVLIFYVFGMFVNTLTDRCDTATQCTVLAPRMAAENVPQFLQIALIIMFSLAQLFVMFWAMIKVGSYKMVYPGTIGVRFGDVWGQDEAVRKIREQVELLEDSEKIERRGGHMPKGVVLWGPPGTGKTLLARAAAGHTSKPLILVPPGAFKATFVGIDLLKVWTLFRTVRKLARRYGGVIVFMDEMDALGSRGGGISEIAQYRRARRYYAEFLSPDGPTPRTHGPRPCYAPGCVRLTQRPEIPDSPAESEPRRMVVGNYEAGALQAFLAAMDGMEEPRGLLNRILVFLGFKPLRPPDYKALFLGATNRRDALDPALMRAGRFGRHIHVGYPKVEGRRKTYEGYFAKVGNDLTIANIEWAARNHARGTGAEIEDIVNEALLVTFRDGRDDPGTIRFPDLMKAMLWVRYGESDGPFERDTARWNVAVHEAGHAVAFHLLARDRQRIWFASIDQRGVSGGMVAPTPLHEDWLLTREEMLADIQVDLASRVAEQLLIGTTTNGHGGDGAQATDTARKMVAYGHASQIGVYDDDEDEVRKQTEDVLGEAMDSCRELLTPRKDSIEGVAKLLYDKGTVAGDQIHDLLEKGES